MVWNRLLFRLVDVQVVMKTSSSITGWILTHIHYQEENNNGNVKIMSSRMTEFNCRYNGWHVASANAAPCHSSHSAHTIVDKTHQRISAVCWVVSIFLSIPEGGSIRTSGTETATATAESVWWQLKTSCQVGMLPLIRAALQQYARLCFLPQSGYNDTPSRKAGRVFYYFYRW